MSWLYPSFLPCPDTISMSTPQNPRRSIIRQKLESALSKIQNQVSEQQRVLTEQKQAIELQEKKLMEAKRRSELLQTEMANDPTVIAWNRFLEDMKKLANEDEVAAQI